MLLNYWNLSFQKQIILQMLLSNILISLEISVWCYRKFMNSQKTTKFKTRPQFYNDIMVEQAFHIFLRKHSFIRRIRSYIDRWDRCGLMPYRGIPSMLCLKYKLKYIDLILNNLLNIITTILNIDFISILLVTFSQNETPTP